ncbi:hypothetical protein TNCV_4637831 [Trichonephila clavipes]|uniref:Uncharacterized protein n=1 Tax=Trichonephila clavipes TaxID=2585209 RepID=A0A8X6WCW0_TRICX|nr:hypothetical protein TNCV_4637831 [Trichonephila clavipes]
MYLREKKSDFRLQWIPVSNGKQRTPSVLFMVFVIKSLHSSVFVSGATAHESQGLLCPSQYTGPLGAEVHKQMSRTGGQSEAESSVVKSQARLSRIDPLQLSYVWIHCTLVVKVTDSWLACLEFETSTAEDPPRRGG